MSRPVKLLNIAGVLGFGFMSLLSLCACVYRVLYGVWP
jgi:hypothetical protein